MIARAPRSLAVDVTAGVVEILCTTRAFPVDELRTKIFLRPARGVCTRFRDPLRLIDGARRVQFVGVLHNSFLRQYP
jgi:hypothetical protein